jgi:hypothetical protein
MTESRNVRSQLWMMMCRQSSGIGWCMDAAEVVHRLAPWVGGLGDELLVRYMCIARVDVACSES